MPRDSSGNVSRTNGVFSGPTTWADQAASADKNINSGRHDTHDEDLAMVLTDSLSRTGKGAMQADLSMAGNKITNLGDGTAPTDALSKAQVEATPPPDGSVTTDKLADDAVATAKIADKAVALAKMADGTQGGILYYGASGVIAELPAGTAGYILTTQGGGSDPVWADNPPNIVLMPSQDTTSGTEFDFTGLPTTVKCITVLFRGVSLSGGDEILIQIGDSGGFETTGYVSTASDDAGNSVSNTTGFVVTAQSGAADTFSGRVSIELIDANTWVSGGVGKMNPTKNALSGGDKQLSDTLDRVRVTRTGSNTFDAGLVSVQYQ